MILILDASAAVRAAFEADNPRWRLPIEQADLILAPDLLPAEAANAFWKYVRAGQLKRDSAANLLRSALELVDEYRSVHELALEAFDLGVLMDRPVYDLVYLAMARRHSACLLTADDKLRVAADRIGIRIAEAAEVS
ncbi:MAG: type II toxin-antitoxin system VapC family toxin [Bryobacteraceae bacterium]